MDVRSLADEPRVSRPPPAYVELVAANDRTSEESTAWACYDAMWREHRRYREIMRVYVPMCAFGAFVMGAALGIALTRLALAVL